MSLGSGFGVAGRAKTVVLSSLVFCSAFTIRGSDIPGQTWTGAPGITEKVDDIMARERALAGNVTAGNKTLKPRLIADRSHNPQNAASPYIAGTPSRKTAGLQAETRTLLSPQAVGVSFLGVQTTDTPYVPPDTMGDVGPSQILICINGRIRTFTRAGAQDGVLDADTDVFFTSVLNGSSSSDPRVRYDRLSRRWFITMINVATPNRVMIAVSSGPTIASTNSFTFFQFQQDLVGTTPNADTGNFADYDTLGVDANALYVGVNMFNPAGTAFLGTTGFVINKANLTNGVLTVTAFRQMATSTGPGPYAPQGVGNDDPASTEGYFIGTDNNVFGVLAIVRVSDPGGTPSISTNLMIDVPATSFPINPEPLGSHRPLDAIDDRLFEARIQNGRLWTAHNIEVDSTGVANSSGGRDGSRWYELGDLTGTPMLVQSGTLFDPAASNPRNFWIPSCAASGQGHMALGCSVGGAAEHAEIAVAGRFASDAAGALGTSTIAQTSSTSYNLNDGSSPHRWGDYSLTTLDPNDNMTLWTFQEYCNAANSWGVRVIQLKAPPPATPSSCDPSSVPQGAANTNVVVHGVSTAGSGFYDPGLDFSNRLAAAVSGSGITINSIGYSDPSNIVLNISVDVNAAVGGRTITVTNPDGQTATSAGSILTVYTPVWALTATAGPGGSVQPTNALVGNGGTEIFLVNANPYYFISDVRTDGSTIGGPFGMTNLVYVWSNVTADGTFDAAFAPFLAPAGTPLWWLANYGLNTDTNDDDQDGMLTWQENWAGTDPTNIASVFTIGSVTFDSETETLGWDSTTNGANQPYALEMTTDLLNGAWTLVTNGIARTPPTNTFPFLLTNDFIAFRLVATNRP